MFTTRIQLTLSLTVATLVASACMPMSKKAGMDYPALVQDDVTTFQAFFEKRFPDTEKADYINGVYSIDADARSQWESLEEFPPYELSVDQGKALYETPFANGSSYATCFGDGAVRSQYPYYDEDRAMVITLELAINECRTANGEKVLKYKKGDLAKVSAYMSFVSRGQAINVDVASEGAYNAYMDGKEFFYSKRGQFNISCADCHMRATGFYLRADVPSPGLGQTSHFPTFRTKWDALGTLHRRYGGCNENIRAKAFSAQSPEYRNLEYFQTVMSNGLVFNGPGSRK
ncbi:MAG: sulfur oxidation c-type cytochrome SoxA [Reinekea forsetii]|jgi:sulfur-oxidizing protein SoxA|uniref:sulfur oxidation c-type cytochrome SoxA n=1 Tax=Reinekea TaxID=230494 RepID=UPI002354D1D7|nr:MULTISPECIES: sulfur oxidation c-type cytochrome SoxA [Reinekea]MDO7673317.1 sulfur oxidation c-type cytochrome SoxA [Reinekea forsetii]